MSNKRIKYLWNNTFKYYQKKHGLEIVYEEYAGKIVWAYLKMNGNRVSPNFQVTGKKEDKSRKFAANHFRGYLSGLRAANVSKK